MSTRIYLVTHTLTSGQKDRRLVAAGSQAAAIRHVARDAIVCAVATPHELIKATKDGIEVETAGEEAREEGDGANGLQETVESPSN